MYSTRRMGRMVRKQLYLDAAQEQKLKRLAARWRCTEAAVVRRALESLPEAPRTTDDEVLDRLIARGIVQPPSGRRLTERELDEIDRELEEIARRHPNLPSVSRIVIEDRAGR
jgi:predicted transcriptional regulator